MVDLTQEQHLHPVAPVGGDELPASRWPLNPQEPNIYFPNILEAESKELPLGKSQHAGFSLSFSEGVRRQALSCPGGGTLAKNSDGMWLSL